MHELSYIAETTTVIVSGPKTPKQIKKFMNKHEIKVKETKVEGGK